MGTLSTVRFPNEKAHVLYAMKVTEKLKFKDYWDKSEYNVKRPKMDGSLEHRRGDNIYDYSINAIIPRQLYSQHSHADGSEDEDMKTHDLGGVYVLISSDFIYFGKKSKPLPDSLLHLIKKGPGHKSNFTEDDINSLEKWLKQTGYKQGVGTRLDDPHDFDRPLSHCHSAARQALKQDGVPADDE